MTRIWRTLTTCILVLAFCLLPMIVMAVDFELFWDPNCDTEIDLEGYYVYYKEDASILGDPDGAIEYYVDLMDNEFDRDNPSVLIPGLLDDVRYCFAVSAWYGTEMSGLSNEVCGINGSYVSDPDPIGPEIVKTEWQLVYVDSEELVAEDGAAVNAFDEDPGTMWHTEWSTSPGSAHPHEIIIDLGSTYDLDGFIYEPYQLNGRIIDYEFFVSNVSDGPWTAPVASGAFADDAIIKAVPFSLTTGRFIRLVAYSEPNGNQWTTVAEIGVTGSLSSIQPNELPVANTGGPYAATDSDNTGSETLTLDGTASYDSDGTITSYQWFENSTLIGTGANPTFSFAVGTHLITLTVIDDDNDAISSNTTVTVYPGPTNELPVANAGGPYTASDFDNSGSEMVTLNGSASYDSDGTITSYQWFENDTLIGTGVNPTISFVIGTHAITLTVTDNRDDMQSSSTTVTVETDIANTPPNGMIDLPATNQTINVGESIRFSGSGSDPDEELYLSYHWHFGTGSGIADYIIDDDPGEVFFDYAGTYTITFTVTDGEGAADPTPDTRVITVVEKSVSGPIAKTDWQLVYVDSEEIVNLDGAATNAFDGNSSTMWHTEFGSKDDPVHPHEIVIDLGDTYDLDGFSYEPYKRRGRVADYEFFVSTDSNGFWTSVASGTFSKGVNVKSVSFPVTTGRYVRLVAYSEVKGKPWTAAMEIGVTGVKSVP